MSLSVALFERNMYTTQFDKCKKKCLILQRQKAIAKYCRIWTIVVENVWNNWWRHLWIAPPKPFYFFWVAKVMGCLGPLANRPLCDYELKVKVTNFVANGQLNHTIILAIRGHRYVNIRYAHIIMNIFSL